MAEISFTPNVVVGYESTKQEGTPRTGEVRGEAGVNIRFGKTTNVVALNVNPYIYGGGGTAQTKEKGTTPTVSDGDGAVETNLWGMPYSDESTTPEVEAGGVAMPESYGHGSIGGGVYIGPDFALGKNKNIHLTAGVRGQVGKVLGNTPVEDYAGLNPMGWEFMAGPSGGVSVDAGPVTLGATGYWMGGVRTSQITSGVDASFDEVSNTSKWGVGGSVGLNLSALGGGKKADGTEGGNGKKPKERPEVSDVRLTEAYLKDQVTDKGTATGLTTWEYVKNFVNTGDPYKSGAAPTTNEHKLAVIAMWNDILDQIEAAGAPLPGNLRGLGKPHPLGELSLDDKGNIVETYEGKTRKIKVDLFDFDPEGAKGEPFFNKKFKLGDDKLGARDRSVIDFDNLDSVYAFTALLLKIHNEVVPAAPAEEAPADTADALTEFRSTAKLDANSDKVTYESGSAVLNAAGKKALDDSSVKAIIAFASANKDKILANLTAAKAKNEPVLSLLAVGFADTDAWSGSVQADNYLGSTFTAGTSITAEMSHELNMLLANARGDSIAAYVNEKIGPELVKLGLPADCIQVVGKDYAKPTDGFPKTTDAATANKMPWTGKTREAKITNPAYLDTSTVVTVTGGTNLTAAELKQKATEIPAVAGCASKDILEVTADALKNKVIKAVVYIDEENNNTKRDWNDASKFDSNAGKLTVDFKTKAKVSFPTASNASLPLYVVLSDDTVYKVTFNA